MIYDSTARSMMQEFGYFSYLSVIPLATLGNFKFYTNTWVFSLFGEGSGKFKSFAKFRASAFHLLTSLHQVEVRKHGSVVESSSKVKRREEK